VVEWVLDFFPEEEKQLRSEIRQTVASTFPLQAEEIARSFGLKALTPFYTTAASVVLIHGLDDPGKVWMNLAPELASRGVNVWQMEYPNDQPISESALLLRDELLRLRQAGVDEISLVAHSMGGLVSRELLTSPEIAYSEQTEQAVLPGIDALIMVGTPNHGSELARFRLLGEAREQWVNFIEDRGHILRGFLDGAGEAKIDLLPGSRFLRTLNERPHPDNINMLIIAGVVNPWDDEEIRGFLNANLNGETASEMEAFIRSMSDGLGDGLVTVESTRLQGIEHRIVSGTHLSMIRNLSMHSERVPPAVPIIVDYLE
jgi:pimeloyl-ACP methyl ester carboxylesterase